MPETTVLLPSRDGWPLLRQAVTSTLADIGTDHDAELLVIDDGSTDETRNWLDGLRHERRLHVIHTGGVGLPAALNAGLAATDSTYVARMDADDIWLPGRLATQLSAMVRQPDLAAVGCQIVRVVGGVELGASSLPTAHPAIVEALLRGHHAICHPSVLMRRAAVDAVDRYWQEGVAEDFDLFLRMSSVGRLANLPEVGLKYRIHGSGINASRQYEVQKRMAFSTATYRLPREACSYEAFEAALRENRIRALNLRRKAVALSAYRAGLVASHGDRRLRGRLQLLGSALLMPERAGQRISRWATGGRHRL
ncbi:glycosyltransferase family 2 protein [Trujillonella humicola]|uniref:glycosyltransferase family 2 protein n=1 Tax=Trujillonella humicola TaxID=3383699 RepID=UPI0039068C82